MKKMLTILVMVLAIVALALPYAAFAADESMVSAPNISVTTSTGSASFTLKSDSTNARIYYTTNGTDPTTRSSRYSSKVTVKSTCEVRAVAYDPNTDEYSNVAYYLVTVTMARASQPTATATAVAGGKKVTLKTSTSGATIYYTTDGSNPSSTNGTRYTTSGITVTEPTIIKAVAVKSGYANSTVATISVTLPELSAPTCTTTATSSGTKVTLKAVSGATIYYTTNGSTPTTKSSKYSSSGFTVKTSTTVKAIAVKNGYRNSDVAIFNINVKTPQVAMPKATKTAVAGGYTVKLSCESGATIYYTLDGSTPTRSDFRYTTSGINVTNEGTTYIRAIAVRSGYDDSDILDYPIDITQLSMPTHSVTVSTSGTKVTLKASSGSTIYYTTNGSTPTTKSTRYSTAFTVKSDCIVKAIAVKNGYSNSDVASFDIDVVMPKLAQPKATKTAVAGGYNVKLSYTSGATVYYTIDGNLPTTSSNKYTSSGITITESGSTTIRAIAVKSGYDNSDVMLYSVQISKLAIPSVKAPYVSNGRQVTLSASGDATIYYTTNGADPTTKSTKYTKPFVVTKATTVKAIAVKNGYANSSVLVANVSIDPDKFKAEAPTMTTSKSGKTVRVTFKTATSGAKIYYTIDGSDPSLYGTAISSGSSVTLTKSCIVRAIARKDGMGDSDIKELLVAVGDDVTVLDSEDTNKPVIETDDEYADESVTEDDDEDADESDTEANGKDDDESVIDTDDEDVDKSDTDSDSEDADEPVITDESLNDGSGADYVPDIADEISDATSILEFEDIE